MSNYITEAIDRLTQNLRDVDKAIADLERLEIRLPAKPSMTASVRKRGVLIEMKLRKKNLATGGTAA